MPNQFASADELVDMAKRCIKNDNNPKAINRPHSSLIIDGNTGVFFGEQYQ